MIVVPHVHNNVLSVSEITLSFLIVAIYTAEDVFVQSISDWLSNGKSQMAKGMMSQQMVVRTVLNCHTIADLCAGFQFAPSHHLL